MSRGTEPESVPADHARRGGTPAQGAAPSSWTGTAAASVLRVGDTAAVPGLYRWSLPTECEAARPASRRATGMRNGEQET